MAKASAIARSTTAPVEGKESFAALLEESLQSRDSFEGTVVQGIVVGIELQRGVEILFRGTEDIGLLVSYSPQEVCPKEMGPLLQAFRQAVPCLCRPS